MPELYVPGFGFYAWLAFSLCVVQSFASLHRFGVLAYVLSLSFVGLLSFLMLTIPHL